MNSSLGRVAEAEQYARESAELAAKLGNDPTQLRIDNAVAESISASDRADYAGAERLLREAIELDRQAQHHKVGRRRDIMYHNLGVALDKQGRKADAEAAFRDALGASEKLFGKDHPTTDLTLADLAGVLRAQGKELDARATDLRRLAIQTRALDDAIRQKGDNTNLYRDRA